MLHQGHISMKYFVKSVYERKICSLSAPFAARPPKTFPSPCPTPVFPTATTSPFSARVSYQNFPGPCVLLKLLAQNFLLSFRASCHASRAPLLTHVARGRGRREQQPKDAAFCFTRKAARQWVGFSGLAHRPRIITDQISDISRGMNVLWCVFYFISLSYNPPSNGTRFSLPPPRRVVLAGSVGGVVLDGVVLCAWPPPNGGARENVECEIKKTWQ